MLLLNYLRLLIIQQLNNNIDSEELRLSPEYISPTSGSFPEALDLWEIYGNLVEVVKRVNSLIASMP